MTLCFHQSLQFLEQSGLNLEDLDNFWKSLPSLNISFWTVLAPKNQEQTSFAVEIENIRTQWYVMTALLSLETKLNPFRCSHTNVSSESNAAQFEVLRVRNKGHSPTGHPKRALSMSGSTNPDSRHVVIAKHSRAKRVFEGLPRAFLHQKIIRIDQDKPSHSP